MTKSSGVFILFLNLLVFICAPWLCALSADKDSDTIGKAKRGEDVLLQAETELLELLDKYIVDAQENVDFLEEFLNQTKYALGLARKDVEGYIGNPINSFLLIRRFTTTWARLDEYFKYEENHDNGTYFIF